MKKSKPLNIYLVAPLHVFAGLAPDPHVIIAASKKKAIAAYLEDQGIDNDPDDPVEAEQIGVALEGLTARVVAG